MDVNNGGKDMGIFFSKKEAHILIEKVLILSNTQKDKRCYSKGMGALRHIEVTCASKM